MTRRDDNATLMSFFLNGVSTQLTAFRSEIEDAANPGKYLLFTPRFPLGFKPEVSCGTFARRPGPPTDPWLASGSYMMKWYGEEDIDANRVHRLAWDALMGDPEDPAAQEAVLTANNIVRIEEEVSGGQDMVDEFGEDEGWPYVLSFFTIHFLSAS